MTQPFRILVCGGRDFTNVALLSATLDQYHAMHNIKMLIEGGAAGADTLARRWAIDRKIFAVTANANWTSEGPAAGPVRNARMLKYLWPDLVVAFPTSNSKGTWDMIRRAERAKVPVAVFEVK